MTVSNTHEYHRQIAMKELRTEGFELIAIAFDLMEYPDRLDTDCLIEIKGIWRALRHGLRELEANNGGA